MTPRKKAGSSLLGALMIISLGLVLTMVLAVATTANLHFVSRGEDSVRGTGTVMVNGSALIEKGAALSDTDAIALASSGDATIGVLPGSSAQFSGMVYSAGNFTARHVLLLGAFVSSGSPANSITLEDVRLVTVPSLTRYKKSTPQPPGQVVFVVPYWASANPSVILGNVPTSVSYQNGNYVYGVLDLRQAPPVWQHGLTRSAAIQLIGEVAFGTPSGVDWVGNHLFDTKEQEAYDRSQGFAKGTIKTSDQELIFDLNQFLDPSYRTRTLLWRRLQ
jgi:hypothetical protein